MPGRSSAVRSGAALEAQVIEIASGLGLEVRRQVRVGRRLWGAERKIDVVATDPSTRRAIGLECKYQASRGTAEEKLPAIISDIAAWPIPGLIVFAGDGFSTNLRQYLYSTGRALDLEDLVGWLELFFGLTEQCT